jgi:diguanylate cyclase (GGDEF)-like protein
MAASLAAMFAGSYALFHQERGQLWLLIPIGVWIVLRLPPGVAAAGAICVAVTAVYETATGDGPLQAGDRPMLDAILFAIVFTSAMLALAILTSQRRRVLDEHRRMADEDAALRRVATAVAADATLTDASVLVGREVAGLLDVELGVVVAFDPRGDRVLPLGQSAPDGCPTPPLPRAVQIEPGSAIDRLRGTGEPARFDERGAGRLSMPPYTQRVAAPIVAGGRLWGALIVCTTREDDLAADVESRLARFAELMGMAITNADARARLLAQATTDPLTGLVNHRAFHERLRDEVAGAFRHDRPLSVAVFDLDRFKQINDTLGHVVGDAVLAEAARRMAHAARAGEVVARIGGDELALLMPGTTSEDGHAAAERVRRAVAERPYDGVGTVTMSAGVCDLQQAGGAEELLRLADGALYWAKAHGRDTCIRYTPEVVEELSADERADRLERARALSALGALAKAIDAKDPATTRHSERVAALTAALAAECGWTPARIARLHDAALVHDVGKIGVPDAILSKPARLTDQEYDVIKRHADLGARIVAGVLDAEQVAWVRGHHERHDGRGYPDGLAAEDISDGARLLALADAWDAMTGARVYSAPMSVPEALAEIRRNDGCQFHPDAVAAIERVHARGGLRAFASGAPTVAAGQA